jgi:small subunit ribosomal protein S6
MRRDDEAVTEESQLAKNADEKRARKAPVRRSRQ